MSADAMFLPFALISAMLAGDPRVLPPPAATAPRVAPRSDAERQRAVFDRKLADYVRLSAEVGAALLGSDFDDRLAELLDDERMTTLLGLAVEIARDVATVPHLRDFARDIEQHDAPHGPLFERPEVTAFLTWIESIDERCDVDGLLQLSTALPASFVSAESAGREFVHLLYDPALPSELRAMMYAVVRISGRSAVLYHARSGDLESAEVAGLFATHEEDARNFERLLTIVMQEDGDMHRQTEWNRSVLHAWMAGVRAS